MENKKARMEEVKTYFKENFNIELFEMQDKRDEFYMLTDSARGILISTGLDSKPDGICVNLLGDPGILSIVVHKTTLDLDFIIYEPFIPSASGEIEFGEKAYEIKAAYESYITRNAVFPSTKEALESIPTEEESDDERIVAGDAPISNIITPVVSKEEVGKIIIP